MHLFGLALYALVALASTVRYGDKGQLRLDDASKSNAFQCDLPSALDPSGDGLSSAADLFTSKDALLKQVERHSGASSVFASSQPYHSS